MRRPMPDSDVFYEPRVITNPVPCTEDVIYMCVWVRVYVWVLFLKIVLPPYKSLSFGLPLSSDSVSLNNFQHLFAYFCKNVWKTPIPV